jgi:hypothetical protein
MMDVNGDGKISGHMIQIGGNVVDLKAYRLIPLWSCYSTFNDLFVIFSMVLWAAVSGKGNNYNIRWWTAQQIKKQKNVNCQGLFISSLSSCCTRSH